MFLRSMRYYDIIAHYMLSGHENLVKCSSSLLESYRQETRRRISEALANLAVRYIIGISGDADQDKKILAQDAIEEFAAHFSDGGYAILTGGTEGGVPQISVETARRLGIPTIGVFPRQGMKYALLNQLDLAIETSPPDIGDGTFGTETPSFVNMLDGATVIGGSYGTLTEAATILKTNMKRARDRSRGVPGAQNPIYFAPISSTGGVANSVYEIARSLGGDTETALGMPSSPVAEGQAAARFIRQKISNDRQLLISSD